MLKYTRHFSTLWYEVKVHKFMYLKQWYCLYIRLILSLNSGNTDVDETPKIMTTVTFPVILAGKCEAEQKLGCCPEFSHFVITSQNNTYLRKLLHSPGKEC